MKSTSIIALASLAFAGTPVFAQPAPGGDAPPAGGDPDTALYPCRKKTGPVTVPFKAEAELKDLVSWAMSFTCKSFMLDPRIVSTGKKVMLVGPSKVSPTAAYSIFLAALSTMGLTAVPMGSNALRIVQPATAVLKPELITAVYFKGIDRVLRYRGGTVTLDFSSIR